jgi:hypothetical protein
MDAITAFDVLEGKHLESVSEHNQMEQQLMDQKVLNDPNDIVSEHNQMEQQLMDQKFFHDSNNIVSEHNQMEQQLMDQKFLNDPNDVLHLIDFHGTLSLAESLSINKADQNMITNDNLHITQLAEVGMASENAGLRSVLQLEQAESVPVHHQMQKQPLDQELSNDFHDTTDIHNFHENSILDQSVNDHLTHTNMVKNHNFPIAQLGEVRHSTESSPKNSLESYGYQMQQISGPVFGQVDLQPFDHPNLDQVDLQPFNHPNLNAQPMNSPANSVRDQTFFYGEENSPEMRLAMGVMNPPSVQMHDSSLTQSSFYSSGISSGLKMPGEYTMPAIDSERNSELSHGQHSQIDIFKTLPKVPRTVNPTQIIDQNQFEYVGTSVASHNLPNSNSMITPMAFQHDVGIPISNDQEMAFQYDFGGPISNEASDIVNNEKGSHNLAHQNPMITPKSNADLHNYDSGRKISNMEPATRCGSIEKLDSTSLKTPLYTSPTSTGWFPKYKKPARCCCCFPRNRKGVSSCLFFTFIILVTLGGLGFWLFPR